MNITFKRKLRGLWKSRTQWAGALLGMLIAIQPMLMEWMGYKLEKEDYILAGMLVTGLISLMRWVTTQPLDKR